MVKAIAKGLRDGAEVERGESTSVLRRGAMALLVSIAASSVTLPALALDENAPQRRPVKAVAPDRLKVKTAGGDATIPLHSSVDLSKTHPDIKRALIVLHGRLRDADRYFDLAQRATGASGATADTVVIAPQMLSSADAARHDVAASVPRWKGDGWMGGEPAKAPMTMSSFEVIDAVMAQLVDRARFPKLERIVIAGHSGGAQFVQRYAVVGRADQVLTAAGLQPFIDGSNDTAVGAAPVMRVRYVIANPSSYVYFDSARPVPVTQCRDADHWRYGMNDFVPYVTQQAATTKGTSANAGVGGLAVALERRYLGRRVIYLSGGNDVDPNHSALDKSCMAQAQGANRMDRSRNYFAHVQKHAAQQAVSLRHSRAEVPGVAHDADRMFNSACGRAALFDVPGCELKLGESIVAR